MKRSGNRLLALLLCMAMVLTLLPMAAFARWEEEVAAVPAEAETTEASKAELPADAPEDGGGQAELLDGGVLGWTARDSGAASCVTEADGKIKLTATGTADFNAEGSAVIVNDQIAGILNAVEGEKFFEAIFEPHCDEADGKAPAFGIAINATSKDKAYYVGFDKGSKWYSEYYGATETISGSTYPGWDTKPDDVVSGEKYKIRVTWNNTTGKAKVKICVGMSAINSDMGVEYTLPYDGNLYGITDSTGKIAIKTSNYNNATGTYVLISDINYTNKPADAVTYTVTGTVSDANSPLPDVAVSVAGSSKKTTTNAQGVYALQLADDTYTLNFAKDGYENASKQVTVNGANMTDQNVTMTAKTVYTLPTDGVKDDTWSRDAQTNTGKENNTGVICEKVTTGDMAGTVHLKSGSQDGNGHGAVGAGESGWPGVYVNETANRALGSAGDNRFVEVTFVRAADSNPRFGLILNYESPTSGFFVGCNTETSGWFMEGYKTDGTSNWQGLPSGGTTPAAGAETTLRIEWSQTKLIGVWQNGEKIIGEYNFRNTYTGKGVGFRMNNYRETTGDTTSEFYIKEMHYSGQTSVTAYPVSGMVKDEAGAAIAGATVTAGAGYTATTDANGAYRLVLPENGIYTITATKAGYSTQTAMVENLSAAVTGKDITLEALPKVTGTVTDEVTHQPIFGASVKLSGDLPAVATDAEGRFEIIGVANGAYTLTVTADGYAEKTTESFSVANADVTQNVALIAQETMTVDTIATSTMTATVNKNFPQVVRYQIGDVTVRGQSEELNTLKLNGVNVVPTVAYEKVDAKTAKYTMTVNSENNNGTNLNVVITARLVVGDDGDNTLAFYIDNVEYAGANAAAKKAERLAHPVETIEVPNHSLVSSRDSAAGATGARFSGGKMSNDTRTRGDDHFSAKSNIGMAFNQGNPWTGDYLIGFVSDNTMSAGLASNSEYGSVGDNYPVRVTMKQAAEGAMVDLSLSSTLWYYNRKTSSSNNDPWHNYYLTQEQIVTQPTELPLFAKVSITTKDENNDDEMNWQDGAIYYRDTVMHKPDNSDSSDGEGIVGIRDAVNFRINLNFGSQAQNPFLVSLDNVKRVAANTDGLGQLILMKGYAGEGHDSNHPDYYDIGERMGGVKDFNTMLEEGKKYGAQFGIHVNATEYYPEADAFNDETVGRSGSTLNEDGTINPGALRYGWNWIDQGINMNIVYDMATGNRAARFKRLYDLVGNNLTFVYVDVWGNGQGGINEDGWMTRRLSKEITEAAGKETNWRIAHEWSYANPYNSTFQHWTSDYTYGNAGYKGASNSDIMRFCLNSYRDSFPADFATFGGACNAPLLGGPSMQGFEGWQKDDEYDLNIENTFNQMVYTKFLQHFDIVKWTNAETAVTVPYSLNANGAHNMSSTSNWAPEMQIVLKSPDKEHTVVVTRGTRTDGVIEQPVFTTLDDEVKYRSRVVTLDGRIIVEGAPKSAGEDEAFDRSKATLKYLIPWNWDASGKEVTGDQEKLYHWNAQGGTSSWELPDSWKSLDKVVLYKLTDQGRADKTELTVNNGWITMPATIEANNGYVVVKGEGLGNEPQITYGTGLHVEDPSFNVDIENGPWNKSGTGTAERVCNPGGISVVKLSGSVALSQTMTDLEPGNYVTYVGVDNQAGRASITVKDETGTVVASNYTMESIAVNYISGYSLHTAAGLETTGGFRANRESRFQNMYIFFTAEAGKTYTLTIEHTGTGDAHFDDVITKTTTAENFTRDEDGRVIAFTQDFEDVAQGQWPFVISGVEGVEDNRQHLSELHAPYTQAGWDVKEMDDVLEGHWSLKVNGLVQKNTLVMQTIPQNFRFEPGKIYTVSFKYQMGSPDIYRVVIGDGKFTSLADLQQIQLEQGMGKDKDNTVTFTVEGSQTGQTWFGIWSTGVAPTKNDSFTGHKEIVIDDLSITLSVADKTELKTLVDSAEVMVESDYVKADGYSGTDAQAWSAFETALTAAQTVLGNANATQAQVDSAKTALEKAIANLKKVAVVISGTVTDGTTPVGNATVILEDATYMPTGLTATTAADGKFTFQATDEVALALTDYQVKVQAAGYQVNTFAVTGLTKQNATANVTCALTAEVAGAYVNDFNSGDVSMMNTFDAFVGGTENDNGPRVVADNGAVKVNFVGWQDNKAEGRWENNLMDKSETAKFANGTVSFDVTPLHCGNYLGITLRGVDATHRIYIGQQSSPEKWFMEWWNGDATSYTGLTTAPITMTPGVTRRVRVTLNDKAYLVTLDGVKVLEGTFPDEAPTAAGYAGINMRYDGNGSGPDGIGNFNSQYVMDNFRVESTDAPAANTYTISGSVKEGEIGVAGAAVTVTNSSSQVVARTTTGADGSYTTLALAAGTYTVTASAEGYGAVTGQTATISNANVENVNFTLTPTKTALQALYDAYKDTSVSASDRNDYTDESFAALTSALAAAEAVINNDNATGLEISQAAAALEQAHEKLAVKPTDFTELKALYSEAELLQPKDYTSGYEALQEALVVGLETINNVNASQKAVDEAKNAIQDAVDGLVRAAVTKDALNAAIEAAEAVTNADYTDASWNAFQEKLAMAKEIAADETDAYTQTQVDKAVKALTDAQAALTKKPSQPTGGGSSAPAETTKTETREDGTKVTTVTKPDGSKTQTVEQPDGTKSETVTTKDGDVTITVTDESGEELVKAEIPATIPEPETKFEDVDTTPWAEEAIHKMAGLELVNGTGGNKYSPVIPMTRGSLATVLHRLSQGKTDYETTFKDVAQGKYYTEGVAWAAKAKVVTGYTAEIFAPDDIITREQLAVMLARYAKLVGLNTKADAKALESFTDGDTTGAWAVDGVAWCVENGILKGKGQNNLDPTADVTRAEVAVMLDRFIALLK